MTKVLITADVHIDDYNTYNPTRLFRLNQFDKLGDELVQKCIENGAEEFWIAGDLLRTPKPETYVMHMVYKFIKKFVDHSITVRIVYGNHDLTVKNANTSIDDYDKSTLLSILNSFENVYTYADGLACVDNKLIRFCSWTPNNDIDSHGFNHDGKIDYLVTHGDIDANLSPFADNLIDYSRYDRAFVGHIHIAKDTDRYSSLGAPIPHSFNDENNTSVILFDVVYNTIKRIPISDNYLKFEYVGSESEKRTIDNENTKNNTHVYVKVKTQKDVTSVKEGDIAKVTMSSLDIDPKRILTEFTKDLKEQSLKVIDTVVNSCSESESELSIPNLNVNFKRLHIVNFLSIKDAEIDFSDYKGLVSIVGQNGTGKSTLLYALQYMLLGSLHGYTKSDFNAINKGVLTGVLTLSYDNHEYEIRRSLDAIEFLEDGNLIDSNNKKDLEQIIRSKLRFIDFMDLLYIKQESQGIFASMTDSNRITFLSKLIGLSLVSKWSEKLSEMLVDLKQEHSSIGSRVDKANAVISEIQAFNDENVAYTSLIDSKDVDLQIENVVNTNKLHEDQIKLLEDNKTEYRLHIQKVQSDKSVFNMISTNKKNDLDEIKNIESKLSYLGDIEDTDLYQKDVNETTVQISSISKDAMSCGELLANARVEYKKVVDELNHYRNHPSECPTCKQKWLMPDLEKKIAELESLQVSMRDEGIALSEKYKSYVANQESLQALLTKQTHRLNSAISKNKDIQSLLSNKSRLENNIPKYDEQLNALNIVDDVEEYYTKIQDCDSKIGNIRLLCDDLNVKLRDLYTELGKIKTNNDIYNKIQSNNERILKLSEEVKSNMEQYDSLKITIDELTKFGSKILSDKGMLVATLLSKVAEYLNTDELLQVTTVSKLQNGNLKPNLNIKLYVPEYNKYVDYDKLSGGQRLQADLRFLNGITNTLGSMSIIFADEIFKFFDEQTIIESASILKGMSVDKIFVVLHGGHENAISDHIIKVTLDKDKGSVYTKVM